MGDGGAGGPPLSKTRRAGGLVFISGQLPRGPDGMIVAGGIEAQTRQALDNLVAILRAEGLETKDVIKVTVWLTDASLAGRFNAVYRDYFRPPFPTRSMVISGLVATTADVEVEAVAALP